MIPPQFEKITWNMSLAQVQQTFPDGEADGHLNRLPDAPLPPGTLFYRVLQAVIGHPWPVLITFTLILQMEASVELHVVHGQCFACLCPYPEYCMVIIAVAIDILQGNLRLPDPSGVRGGGTHLCYGV